ncbi:hypothetical protein M9458_045483, partial [Cirrhinus mrigala]
MYSVHRQKNGIYANISLFLSYSEVTLTTRSSPDPDQMVTAVLWIQSHLETTSTALNVSRDHIDHMSPRDGSPVKTS